MALHVFHFKADGVVASGYTRVVDICEIANQTIVVKFEVIIIKILFEDGVGTVGRGHHEVHFLDVIPSKGIPHFNTELHLTEFRSVVGGPFGPLRIVPIASKFLVATMDTNA